MKFDRTSLSLAAFAFAAALSGSVHAAETRVFPTDLTNIAAAANGGRIIESSSQFNNDVAFGAANLIDGQIYNPTTKIGSNGWVSGRFDPVNMDTVTFGFRDNELHRIGKLVLNAASSVAPERWAKDVEVQVSTEAAAGPYTSVAQLTLKRSPEPQEFLILPTQARFVRLMFRSNWGSDRAVALGEVEMYEAIDTAEPIGGVIARLESAIKDLELYNVSQRELSSVSRVAAPHKSGNKALVNVSAPARLAQAETPAAAALPATNGGNIAAAKNGGRVIAVSSTYGNDPGYSANNLIDGTNFSLADGKGSRGWASEGFAPGRQSVTIGFRDDRTRLISKIVINPVSDQSTLRWASRVEVQVTTGSPTDGPWRVVDTLNIRTNSQDAARDAVNQDFEIRAAEAKYVRFVFTANGPGNPSPLGDPNISSNRSVALGEIEIYEPIAASDLVPLIGRFNQILIDLKRLRNQKPAPAVANAYFNAPGAVSILTEARVTSPRAMTMISSKPKAPQKAQAKNTKVKK